MKHVSQVFRAKQALNKDTPLTIKQRYDGYLISRAVKYHTGTVRTVWLWKMMKK
jgi:hypothetical protein